MKDEEVEGRITDHMLPKAPDNTANNECEKSMS